MRGGFAGHLNVYRTMAHHPDLLRAWANLREHIVHNNVLGAQSSEVVILRAGHRLNSAYEWAHHVSRARKTGMDDARIETIAHAPEKMSVEDGVLARAVDDLMAHSHLSSETLEALLAQVGKQGVLDVIATVGFYSTLGYILNSFDVPLDEALKAELLDRPLGEA